MTNPLNGVDFTGGCGLELVGGGLVGVAGGRENMLLRKTVEMQSTCTYNVCVHENTCV